MIGVPDIMLRWILPEVVMATGMVLVLLLDAFMPDRETSNRRFLAWLTTLTGIGAVAASMPLFRTLNKVGFGGMLFGGPYGAAATLWVGVIVAVSAVAVQRWLEERKGPVGPYLVLLLASAIGASLLMRSANLIMVYIAIETLSLPLYAMAAYDRSSARSTEAGIKYFVLGSVASALLLYGVALLYGAAGSMQFTAIFQIGPGSTLWLLGWTLFAIGLLFKLAIAPLHFWSPDVYEGSPVPAVMYMASIVKVAVVALLLRVVVMSPGLVEGDGLGWMMNLAMLSMVVGNILALVQRQVVRMLAYSSVAHAGYILAAVAAGGLDGVIAAQVYTWVYALLTLGAFGVLAWLAHLPYNGTDIESLEGLSRRHPLVALMFSIFLLGMAGIPPVAGFFGKWVVLQSLVRQTHVVPAVVLVLSSAAGVLYYLRPVVQMYMRPPYNPETPPAPFSHGQIALGITLGALSVAVLLLGLRGNLVYNLAENAARYLTGL